MNFLHQLSDAAHALLKDGGHAAKSFAISEESKVAVALAGALGPQAAAAIEAAADPSLSKGERFEKAFVAFAPEVLKLATAGDPSLVIDEVETIGRQALQIVFTDKKSGSAGKAATAIAAALHL